MGPVPTVPSPGPEALDTHVQHSEVLNVHLGGNEESGNFRTADHVAGPTKVFEHVQGISATFLVHVESLCVLSRE